VLLVLANYSTPQPGFLWNQDFAVEADAIYPKTPDGERKRKMSNQQILKVPRAIILDAVVPASQILYPAAMQIPNDADFELWFISLQRTSALLKLLINEAATGNRALILAAAPQQSSAFQGIFVDNLAGLVAANGAFPVAVPYIMPAARSYPHQFTDLSGAQNTVQIAYHGYALMPVSNS
jgi:hypothetical protein